MAEALHFKYPIIDITDSVFTEASARDAPAAQSYEEPQPQRPSNGNGKSNTANLVAWTPPPPAAEGLVTWQRPNVEVQHETLPEKLDGRLVLLRDPASERANRFRLLRHRLLGRGDPHLIAVTSALSGEGKTTSALNLGLAIAEEASARVLVVEANVHTPVMGQIFGFRPIECFSEQVGRGDGPLRPWIVVGLDAVRLHVAAVDAASPMKRRLDRLQLGAALRDLRSVYDYVIVDTPAALEIADTSMVADCVDGVIIVARGRHTRRRHVRRVLEQLSPAPIVGLVLLDSIVKAKG
jgi:Mrp family chromosome partitioning ATPase